MNDIRCLICLGEEPMYLAEDYSLKECPHCGAEVEE